jgi:hypothetical protein
LMSFENLRVHHEISLLAHLRFGESHMAGLEFSICGVFLMEFHLFQPLWKSCSL